MNRGDGGEQRAKGWIDVVEQLLQLGNAHFDQFTLPRKQESLLIGGWVAMWRRIEIFLYDWWPILAEATLADRLRVIPVRISYKQDGSADAWWEDWPATSPAARTV